MRLSHDIWHKITQCFEHGAGDDDAVEKRRVLFNLAVVSRSLSGLALTTLWKDIDSLLPVVEIINHFTPAQEDPLLTWIDGDNCKYWKFPRKPNGDNVDLRVKEYLGRIRVFHADGGDESEQALWPILITWFGKAEPLLPNLQALAVYFEDGVSAPLQYLTFMVPPRLEYIRMVDIQSFGNAITFFQLLLSQGCSPVRVDYNGDVPLPPTITLLENLRTLVTEGPYEYESHGSPFSLLELLKQLPSLEYLDIDLGTLRIQTPDPPDPFEHLALETLLLQGTTEELEPLLSFPIVCPSVNKLSLEVRFNTNLTWKFLLEKAIAIFPNLKSLTLGVPDSKGTPRLVLSDLHDLLLQPMESLVVEDIPNKLFLKELQQMLSTWPHLHTLTLTGGKTPFDAEALLSTFTYRNLRTLQLPWDFLPLTSILTCPPATQKNPLEVLRVAAHTKFPSGLTEKVAVAQNLLILLPELKTVAMNGKQLGAEAADLQIIVKGMQAVATAARSG